MCVHDCESACMCTCSHVLLYVSPKKEDKLEPLCGSLCVWVYICLYLRGYQWLHMYAYTVLITACMVLRISVHLCVCVCVQALVDSDIREAMSVWPATPALAATVYPSSWTRHRMRTPSHHCKQCFLSSVIWNRTRPRMVVDMRGKLDTLHYLLDAFFLTLLFFLFFTLLFFFFFFFSLLYVSHMLNDSYPWWWRYVLVCTLCHIQYSTTLLSLCREICLLAHHLHKTFNTFYNKTSTIQ